MDLKNCGIVITGAGSGFGREMALMFSNQNASIYALDINVDALDSLKEENSNIISFPCNVADGIEVDNVMEELFNLNDNINVLVNNAGIMKNSLLVNLLNRPDGKHSIDLWNEIISINQTGVFNMTRSFSEKLLRMRAKGAIINISSIASKGNVGQTAYSASKAAVEAMSNVWAKELGRFGIRSVAIAPGFMDTAGTAEALEERMLSHWVDKTPLGRTGTIQEVVKAVQFAIENDYLNGTVVNVDGGLVI